MTVKIDLNTFKNLGRIVLFHRKKAGLSRLDLATIAGVGKTVVYDIENSKETVRTKTLLKVLNALNIKVLLDSPIMERITENTNAQR